MANPNWFTVKYILKDKTRHIETFNSISKLYWFIKNNKKNILLGIVTDNLLNVTQTIEQIEQSLGTI